MKRLFVAGFSFGFSLCLAASCEPGAEIYFDSCTHEDSSVHLHEVQLGDDGDVSSLWLSTAA